MDKIEELAREIIGDVLDGECYCDRDELKKLFNKVDKLRTEVGYYYDHFHDEE